MIENFNDFFIVPNEKPRYKSSNDENAVEIRFSRATEQSLKPPTSYSKVFAYISEFLEECRVSNSIIKANNTVDTIDLNGNQAVIFNNGIIAKNCTWIKNIWNDTTKHYTQFEKKYYTIQNKFGLSHSKNILWFKFTKDGYLGVVAKGQDINFDDDNFSGKCIKKVSKEWDKSFVFIFPLTTEILGKRTPDEIENAVGNYLISKGVPIIDYYSHNY